MTGTEEPDAPKSLDEAKSMVERKFLGCCGIHGVGKKASINAVRVYVDSETSELKKVVERIRAQCVPFLVDVVVEEKPRTDS